MHEIIKLTTHTIDGETQQTVCGRELHAALESKKDYSGWAKYQIERAGFLEGVDYVKTQDLSSPNLGSSKSRAQIRIEYHFTISAAKEIAMMSGSSKGKAVRLYFIQCEKELKEVKQNPALPDFTNPAIAARAWAEQYEKNQALQEQILLEAPKVQAAEDFLKSDGDHIIRKVAKALGVGVRFLYDWLRQKKIITKFNEPYAEFVTRGYLRPCPSYHEGHDGTRKCDLTTHITNEGIFYIWNRLKKEGHIPEGRQLQLEFLKEAA